MAPASLCLPKGPQFNHFPGLGLNSSTSMMGITNPVGILWQTRGRGEGAVREGPAVGYAGANRQRPWLESESSEDS